MAEGPLLTPGQAVGPAAPLCVQTELSRSPPLQRVHLSASQQAAGLGCILYLLKDAPMTSKGKIETVIVNMSVTGK